MKFSIDRSSGKRLVEQVADTLKAAISRAEFTSGDVLPSIDRLSAMAGVSEKVSRKALARLAADGWARPKRGVGSVVQAAGENANGKKVLLFVTGEMWSYYSGQFSSELQWCIQRAGYRFVTVMAPGLRPDCDYSQLAIALKERWDLIIEMGGYGPSRRMIEASSVPFVVIRSSPNRKTSSATNCIGSIYLKMGKALPDFVKRCNEKGVKRVLQFLYGVGGFNAEDMLRISEIEVDTVSIPHARSLEALVNSSMRAMTDKIAKGKALPDVILFTDDFIARGGLLALSANGIRVPGDVAVVTNANTGFCPAWTVPLTRLEMDPIQHGAETANLLLRWFKNGPFPIQHEIGSVWKPGRTF